VSTPVKDAPPLDIEEVAPLIERLYSQLLCDVEVSTLDPEAEEYFFLALGAVSQAKRFLKIAIYKTRQARK
jgi:hypothetical protein